MFTSHCWPDQKHEISLKQRARGESSIHQWFYFKSCTTICTVYVCLQFPKKKSQTHDPGFIARFLFTATKCGVQKKHRKQTREELMWFNKLHFVYEFVNLTWWLPLRHFGVWCFEGLFFVCFVGGRGSEICLDAIYAIYTDARDRPRPSTDPEECQRQCMIVFLISFGSFPNGGAKTGHYCPLY